MKTIKKHTLFSLLMILQCIGCSSSQVNVQHYLLHSPEKPAATPLKSMRTVATISHFTIADYLRQSSLIVEVDDHKLHFSPQDLWAEPLDSSFKKALIQDLNKLGAIKFVDKSIVITEKNNLSIALTLEHFHITKQASVIASGNYLITQINSKEALHKPFYFEVPLQLDGYPHSVIQLRSTINLLAKQLFNDAKLLSSR